MDIIIKHCTIQLFEKQIWRKFVILHRIRIVVLLSITI